MYLVLGEVKFSAPTVFPRRGKSSNFFLRPVYKEVGFFFFFGR